MDNQKTLKSNSNSQLSDELIERIRSIRLVAFDFDGVFTDNMVYVLEDGREAVRCNRSDGIGLQRLKVLGIATIIISTETNCVVSARSRKLKIECIQGCEDKIATLRALISERNVSLNEVAFVGNDINDACCLNEVGLPIVVADAHADVLHHALYRTQAVGGRGAVREVCDLFARVLKER